MEAILKKITLNDFKNYNPNVEIQCMDCDTSECWNKIPKDLIITDSILLENKTLPLVRKLNSNNEEYYVLRYYNLKKLYIFFDMYKRLMDYYRLIEVKGDKKWLKCSEPKSFDRSLIFVTLPSVKDFECGTVIATNIYQETYLTYTGGGDAQIEQAIKDLFTKYFTNDSSLTYDTPYINIPLYIYTDITDCGEMMNTLQKWEANKQYYVSDIVFYEGEYYVAKVNNSSHKFMIEDWEQLKLITPNSSNVESFEVYSESKLSYFKPQRKSYDIFGNALPFIANNKSLTLQYKHGYSNYEDTTNATFVDFLDKVEFNIDGQWVEIEPYHDENDYNPEANNMYVIATQGNNTIPYFFENQYSGVTEVKFTYFIDVQVKDGTLLKDETGVKYEEIRGCYVEEEEFNITGTAKKYKYLKISDLSTYSEEKELIKPYAKITSLSTSDRFVCWEDGKTYFKNDIVYDYITDSYYKCITRNTNKTPDVRSDWEPLNFSNLFVNDKLFGTSYVDFDVPKVTINRGNYTAMERHYVLGEINSFDDLEKYRNNLFKL